ncbi:MAG: hypothetical protein LBG59_02415 [Candidatus Peribacteria bacterium]|jgi:hypothetical protein|nr:hypothetical protein [Candidatus Peribacteria bacterium]
MTHKEELSLENIQKRKELDKNSLQTTGDTKNILDNHYKQEKRPSL